MALSTTLPKTFNFIIKKQFGIGDDTAVIDQNNGPATLVSKDMLLEGIDFDLHYTPLKHLGYKAIAVNVSDIAAMFGTPKWVLIGLAVYFHLHWRAFLKTHQFAHFR